MRPEQAIAMLDRALVTRGENVVLTRRSASGSASATCRAKVSGYDPQELVGDISQQDSKVILSPTGLSAASWPGADNGPPTPQKGDACRVQGFPKIVQAATAVQMDGVTVRIEMRVRGVAT